MFCLMHGMTVRLSLTVMTATSVMLFVRWGSEMSDVVLNCAECGAYGAVAIPSTQTTGVVSCLGCGAAIDVAHAYAHAPWCLVCGEDVSECVCEGFSCDQCGASLDGVVCEGCLVCPEPAGYWAWDADTLSDYLITLDRAAAHYGARGRGDIAAVIMAHHAVMSGAS